MSTEAFKLHPITLVHVGVKKLYLNSNLPPDASHNFNVKELKISTNHTEYNQKIKGFSVRIGAKFGSKEVEKHPFELDVEIVGSFSVDEDNFPTEHINAFAEKNAPVILYPYLRAQLYSLTIGAGFAPLLLPLVEVPTFTLQNSEE